MKSTEVFLDGSVEGRQRGKEGKSNEAERRENTEREATGVNGMATEKRSCCCCSPFSPCSFQFGSLASR